MPSHPLQILLLALVVVVASALLARELPTEVDLAPLRAEIERLGRLAGIAPVPDDVPAEPSSPANALPDPLAGLDAAARAIATDATVSERRFHLVAAQRPAAFCAALRDAGLPMSGWEVAALSPKAGLCTSEVIAVGDPAPMPPVPVPSPVDAASDPADPGSAGPDAADIEDPDLEDEAFTPPAPLPSSLFIVVQGPANGDLDRIRIKMNIENTATSRDTRKRMQEITRLVFATLRWPEVPGLARAIDNLDPFERDWKGVRVRFSRERGDVPRFNLVLAPRPPAAASSRDVSRFRPADPRSARESLTKAFIRGIASA
ncbi:DUF6030 family protein [Methylobrevis pamukkalensis]|uniref:Uncharacterized protein n=1 Tax=Methylobrevis pamukkalensis TaxID=1439726 RepID=A0A1E3GZD0_9HYPH|nr:DUF6030 family protein [Methylobrevis pamukkalensis]ODN69420.1 hypothetical protein A6302_03288 [Methylobrevis pamukkalensis]